MRGLMKLFGKIQFLKNPIKAKRGEKKFFSGDPLFIKIIVNLD